MFKALWECSEFQKSRPGPDCQDDSRWNTKKKKMVLVTTRKEVDDIGAERVLIRQGTLFMV